VSKNESSAVQWRCIWLRPSVHNFAHVMQNNAVFSDHASRHHRKIFLAVYSETETHCATIEKQLLAPTCRLDKFDSVLMDAKTTV